MSVTTISPKNALRSLDDAALQSLLNAPADDGPCISIYLPTHRRGSETRENSIRYKALLKQVREELSGGNGSSAEAMSRVEALEQLAEDNDFWQHQLDGLAIFSSKSTSRMYRVGTPFRERAAVADSFHVKPIIRVLQTAGRYHLLALTAKSVRLYEGGMNGLDEVPLKDEVPRSVIEALGGQLDGELNVNSYGGLSNSGMFHGHHDSKDERSKDRERYLRAVDRAIYDYHRRDNPLPLYLAADVDYHDTFFGLTHDPRATKKGIRINPDAVEVDQKRLHEEMKQVMLPDLDKEVHELVEQFGNAKAKQQGSDDLNDVALAAQQGRVLTLLVSDDMSVGGRIDPATGKVTLMDESDPDADDLLDDLCEMAMKTGGNVRVIPGDKHPSDSGVAAVYRY